MEVDTRWNNTKWWYSTSVIPVPNITNSNTWNKMISNFIQNKWMTLKTNAKWIHTERKMATISVRTLPFIGGATLTKNVGQWQCVQTQTSVGNISAKLKKKKVCFMISWYSNITKPRLTSCFYCQLRRTNTKYNVLQC